MTNSINPITRASLSKLFENAISIEPETGFAVVLPKELRKATIKALRATGLVNNGEIEERSFHGSQLFNDSPLDMARRILGPDARVKSIGKIDVPSVMGGGTVDGYTAIIGGEGEQGYSIDGKKLIIEGKKAIQKLADAGISFPGHEAYMSSEIAKGCAKVQQNTATIEQSNERSV